MTSRFSNREAFCLNPSFPVHSLLTDVGFPLMFTHCISPANISIIDIVVKIISPFDDQNIAMGKKERDKRNLIYMYPRQVSRERTALTQYDKEGFEKLSSLCDQSTDKAICGKVKRKGMFAHGQIQKGRE